MDDIDPPGDFEAHNTENKIFVCGHLNVSIRTLMGSEKLKDRGKNRAAVVPGTEPYLRDVLGFLRNNAENIRQVILSGK